MGRYTKPVRKPELKPGPCVLCCEIALEYERAIEALTIEAKLRQDLKPAGVDDLASIATEGHVGPTGTRYVPIWRGVVTRASVVMASR